MCICTSDPQNVLLSSRSRVPCSMLQRTQTSHTTQSNTMEWIKDKTNKLPGIRKWMGWHWENLLHLHELNHNFKGMMLIFCSLSVHTYEYIFVCFSRNANYSPDSNADTDSEFRFFCLPAPFPHSLNSILAILFIYSNVSHTNRYHPECKFIIYYHFYAHFSSPIFQHIIPFRLY